MMDKTLILNSILLRFRWHPWRCFRSSSTQVLSPEMRPLSSLPSMYTILRNSVPSKLQISDLSSVCLFVFNELFLHNIVFPIYLFSCQVWLGCLWHPGEVPRLVPGQLGHRGGTQGQTQHQDTSLGGLPNQGPQPQNPFLLSWWTAGDSQQIW